jgi:hypothetical protein
MKTLIFFIFLTTIFVSCHQEAKVCFLNNGQEVIIKIEYIEKEREGNVEHLVKIDSNNWQVFNSSLNPSRGSYTGSFDGKEHYYVYEEAKILEIYSIFERIFSNNKNK